MLGNAAMTLGPCLRLFSQENQTIVRKLATKLLQRLGTTFLPPKVAKWRYKRGCRSLLVNLQTTKPISTSVNGASAPLLETKIDDDDDDDLCDVPSEMEEIVDQVGFFTFSIFSENFHAFFILLAAFKVFAGQRYCCKYNLY